MVDKLLAVSTPIRITTFGFATSSSAGIEDLPYEPADIATLKSFHVKRVRQFESVVSSVARFAGGHRTMHNRHLKRLDTHYQKLCRSIVGHPPGTGWTLEWHKTHHASSESEVGSGQGRKAGPFDGAGAENKYIYIWNCCLHAAKRNKRIKIWVPWGCCPKPHPSDIWDSHTGNTQQGSTPKCFADGPHVEYQNTLNPPMRRRRQTGNMLCQNPIIFTRDVRPCARAAFCNKTRHLFTQRRTPINHRRQSNNIQKRTSKK